MRPGNAVGRQGLLTEAENWVKEAEGTWFSPFERRGGTSTPRDQRCTYLNPFSSLPLLQEQESAPPRTLSEKMCPCFDFRIIMIGDFVLLNLSWLSLAP